MAVDQSLIERIAQSLRTARASLPPKEAPANDPLLSEVARRGLADVTEGKTGSRDSILTRAAELYGSKRGTEDTPPTGFDPAAAALFEALVEGAFLVANADGEFDDEERAAFEQVVLAATNQRVAGDQLAALLADLSSQLGDDGMDKRLQVVARTVAKAEAQHEVLRVAALVAQISGGVSDVERSTMTKLAAGFGLPEASVDAAIAAAKDALAS